MFGKLLNKLSGWKTVIGYVLLLIPGLSDHPMLLGAIEKVLREPSAQNLIELAIQLLLAAGVSHRVVKNLSK